MSQAFFPKLTLNNEPTIVESRHTFLETIQELQRAITDAGATVFATVDQQAAAVSVGLSLRPTVVVLFGNPKGGSPLMDACPIAGLELPLKIMIWEDHQIVRVAHAPITTIAERYQLSGHDRLIDAMALLLKRVINAVSTAG